VEAVVLERRQSAEVESSRAGGLHARTIEVFDQRLALWQKHIERILLGFLHPAFIHSLEAGDSLCRRSPIVNGRSEP
jgi:hypothetical protein